MEASKDVIQWAQERGIYRGGKFRVGIRDATYEDVNPDERTFVVMISSVRKDRAGDVVEPRGALLDDYKRNPVVLWAHSYDLPPIARSQWIRITDSGLKSKTEFAKSKLAEEIYGLYADRFLNAWSIGFMPVEVEAILEKHDEEDPRPSNVTGYRFTKWDLLEYSAVPVPMNPDAVTDMIKTGKMSEQLLIKSFQDYVPDLSKPEEGFDNRIEEMNQADTERDREVAEAVKQMGKDGVMIDPEAGIASSQDISQETVKDAPMINETVEVESISTAIVKVADIIPAVSVTTLEQSQEGVIEKPYENEHACRLRDPDGFQEDSFRRTKREHEGKEYSVISGKLKDEDTMTEQAYRYDKDVWEADMAEKHCTDHEGSFEPATGKSTNEAATIFGVATDDTGTPVPELIELENSLGKLSVDDLNDILKEGRVLSSKNRTLINDAISTMRKSIEALQDLLDATEPTKEDSAEAVKQKGTGAYDTPESYKDEDVIEIDETETTPEKQEEDSDASDDEIELEVTGDEIGKHITDVVTGVIRRMRGSVN